MSFQSINSIERKPWGMKVLASIVGHTSGILTWKNVLESYECAAQRDELNSWLTCVLALKAVSLGNFGVGSILVNGNQEIVAWGHNQVFKPNFASGQHAEMVVMDRFEESNTLITGMKALTLFTSLESCPMCLSRLITSRVGTVSHLAEDNNGGMVHKIADLPHVWQQLSMSQTFKHADCSQTMSEAALMIFLLNADELDGELMARGGQ